MSTKALYIDVHVCNFTRYSFTDSNFFSRTEHMLIHIHVQRPESVKATHNYRAFLNHRHLKCVSVVICVCIYYFSGDERVTDGGD